LGSNCKKLAIVGAKMRDSFSLDETDRALVNALQIAPRAPWSLIGQVLDIDAATAARRWERITGLGLAWVTAYPTPSMWARHHCMAYVEVDCQPSKRDDVVDTLVHVRQVSSLSVLSSGRDLVLTVKTPDLKALSQLVMDRLNKFDGITRTSTHTVTRLYIEGNTWRLDALTPRQRQHLTTSTPPRPQGNGVLQMESRPLLLALADGRRTVSELAANASMTVQTTRRRLNHMIDSGMVSFRCDTIPAITGWPVQATFWAMVRPDRMEATANALRDVPEVRMCAAVTGSDNLMLTVWLRSFSDSYQLEVRLAERLGDLTLTERAITLRAVKRMGHVLDDEGRSTGIVPVDPWSI
jgi:DNA-binding Lrp family transcriptional regulator